MPHVDRTVWRGGVLALVAAVLFGASTPFIQRWGSGAGAFWIAALLYIGAAAAGWLLRRSATHEPAPRREHLPRLVVVALLGAALGPSLLAWGLKHTSASSASLVLVLEAAFTVLLARLFYAERFGRRVVLALSLMTIGGSALVLDGSHGGAARLMGLLAVVLATLAWALDNVLSRALADLDPGRVVLGKAGLGAAMTTILALLTGEQPPAMSQALALLIVGAIGYGLSLRFYLLAQRAFGAARTGSVFAFAPFVGALLSVALAGEFPGWSVIAGGLLMLTGVVLHLTERRGRGH